MLEIVARFPRWAIALILTLLLVTHDARGDGLSGTTTTAAVGRFDPKLIPEPLRPWTSWALHGKSEGCPMLQGVTGGTPQCTWPARIELILDEKRGTFKQVWHADARRWVPLPGDDKRWPFDVAVDQKRAVVAPREGTPSVEMERGDHILSGSFAWDSLPESIQIPPQTALVNLTLRGKVITSPNRDAKGTVWLQKTVAADEGERLDFVVHRRITDDIPVLLTTRIVMNVAGRNREVLLGKTLPPGFIPMALTSDLPTRVEGDTRLRVQARPGTWTVELTARSERPVHALTRTPADGPWREGEEVWVFDARTNLRLVDVQGVAAIDPQQTSLPESWKRMPAYPLAVGDTLRFVEKRRGNAEPPPDHLSLERELWLDFDGRGLTATDKLNGHLQRASRLEMQAPTVLGRVSVGGEDQFITQLAGKTATTGVEVRQGEVNVNADSRVLAQPSDLPAVGWNHDFHSVSSTLHLPPGFRLLHASGVDDVQATWIKHWTLLELFLALVLAIGVWRLFGAAWGALALLTFTLTFPELGAPRYVVLLVLIVEALFRALDRALTRATSPSEPPPSRGLVVSRKLAFAVRAASAAALVLIAIPFLIHHVRVGLFPALAPGGEDSGEFFGALDATHGAGVSEGGSGTMALKSEAAPQSPEEPTVQGQVSDAKADEATANNPKKSPLPATAPTSASAAGKFANTYSGKNAIDYRQFNAAVYDPSAMVQTGPGRPRWTFTSIHLKWSGPVERDQRLHLYLLSPSTNIALAILRALLVMALVLRLLPVRPRRGRGQGGQAVLTFAATVFLFLASSGVLLRTARAQTVPPKEILEELTTRLLEPPACSPTCASSSRMILEATKSTLRLRVEIEASAYTSVPLPGSAQWSPETIVVDGKPARALLRNAEGRLWLAVDKGFHQVLIEGPLPDRELIQIELPLKPHRTEVQTDGWRVDGLHEDGLVDDNLQLTRTREAGSSDTKLDPSVLAPFVRVERTLLLGLDWQVTTRVVRLSPVGTAIVLEVPLLKGESVTTADVRVAGSKAQINIAPLASEVKWQSVIDKVSPLVLTASKGAGWMELWRLDMSPVWHAEFAGVPVVQAEPTAKLPEWRPWPGETASLTVSRPDGVVGRTLTIDESTYAIRPGLRATDATLVLQIRSSRGAHHTVTLPDSSVLESIMLNGQPSQVQQEGRAVSFPVSPGSQSVSIAWRMPRAMGFFFSAPELDLGAPSVNAKTTITVPEGRWLLALRGPRLGPVVLFWGLLAVVLAVACAVGAMRRTPLRTWEWMLLSVGLSQVSVLAAAVVVLWIHLLAWRESSDLDHRAYNARQLAIAFTTAVTFCVLLAAVHQGLLGHPDMQVSGYESTLSELRWFTDRAEPRLTSPLVVSAPMFIYRFAMLGWALWLALSVVGWLRWGFAAFARGGFWRRKPRIVTTVLPIPAAEEAPPE